MDSHPLRAQAASLTTFARPLAERADVRKILRRSGAICAALLVLLGIAILIGWAFDIDTLKHVVRGRVSMKANTALGFLLSGISLSFALSHLFRANLLARLFAALVVLLAAASLSQYLFNIDLHIDQLIFHDYAPSANPGRMAYVTSVAFSLGGVSLLFFTGGRASRFVSLISALLLSALSLTSIIGYLYGVPVLYGSFSNVNSMALHTGAGFLVLSSGLLMGQSDSAITRLLSAAERGSWLMRRMLPLLILLPVLLGYLYLQPAFNFGQLRFGMALFAVTLVVMGVLSLALVSHALNRAERQQREMTQVATEAFAAIEISERELRLVTDNLPTLIAYIDASERFVRVNLTFEAWLGLPTERIVGRTVRDVLGNSYWENTRAARDVASRGTTSSAETLCPTIYGDRCAIATFAPDLDENGELRGFATMVVDVEDQRKAEKALRLNEKLAAVGRLSSSMAHEINNPVDAAMNLIYLAQEQVQDDEVRSLLEVANGELKRAANVANETLRFHKQSGNPERIFAADLFQSVLLLHDQRIRNNRIQVEHRDRALQPFECLEGEIRQVLSNLIANALDATPPGGKLLLRSRPATEWSSGRSGIALTIADNGAGMEEHTLSRIFEAFFTTKGVGGTGLGLWISAEILTRNGARMRIRTSTREDAHGSVFVIFLPKQYSAPASESL